MDKAPDKIEVSYIYLKDIFDIFSIRHSIPPTDEEMRQLFFTIKEKMTLLKKHNFEPIRELLSIDPIKDERKEENNILVVDDLVMVTYQLSILLSKMGYKVSLARSAPEAISLFKSGSYNYVLMDLYLPEKEDGLSLLHSVKNKINMENLQTKIIVMSGIADAASVEYCLNHGANSFIEKSDDWKREIITCLETTT